MKAFPITLGVVRPRFGAANKNAAMGAIGAEADVAVFTRDDHTCQCCGFRSEKYQKVLHINGDERDFSPDNTLTTCVFCHQCFDLGAVATMQSGMLIWLPELTQADLSHLMRAVYIGRLVPGPVRDIAQKTYQALMARGEEAKRRLGSTDPEALAIVMRDFLPNRAYDAMQGRLDGIRLMALDKRMVPANTISPHITEEGAIENEFAIILSYWRGRNGPFATLQPQDWIAQFAQTGGDTLTAA